jgi:DNA modification methylase
VEAAAIRNRVKELRFVRADSLKPNPHNWRTHPASQRKALQAVLAEVGYCDALLARELPDGTLELCDGHLRAETTPDANVPVLVIDVNEAEARTIIATLDPLAAMAEEDDEKLKELLQSIESESAEMQALVARIAEDNTIDLVEENAAGQGGDDFDGTPQDGECMVKPGEIWKLGEHRLLCGDSRNAEDVARLFADEKAVLMNTDPPYGVDYAGVKDGMERFTSLERNGKIQNDDLTDGAALQEFLEGAIRAALPVLIQNPAFYLWHPMLTQGTFFAAAAAAAADILIHRQIIWVKPHMVLTRSGMYHWKHELCFYGWIRGTPCAWYGGKSQVSVWEIGEHQQGRAHPTQKPIELFTRPIQNHTREGEICYEPFAGSGSQFIAAERLKRRCFGVEIESRYCDVVVRRWEAETGRKGELECPAEK